MIAGVGDQRWVIVTELYNITGGSARQKKCPKKHGGFSEYSSWRIIAVVVILTDLKNMADCHE
jgi:hypothetical protein